MEVDNEQNSGVNIELSAEIAQGSYVNLAVIGHSGCEFILDFIRVMPGVSKAPVTNRLIMTPENAKRLLLTLHDNVANYEKQFGEIEQHNEPINNIPMGFGSPNAKA
ncbi:MAG: DUF3467 domain-containing protein [Bacteroidales bacterium]